MKGGYLLVIIASIAAGGKEVANNVTPAPKTVALVATTRGSPGESQQAAQAQAAAPMSGTLAVSPDPTLNPNQNPAMVANQPKQKNVATVHHPQGFVNGSEIADTVRDETCNNQVMFCDNVCGVEKSRASVNDCDANSLSWSCMCENGLQPNTTAYTFPVEFVVCTELLRGCQARCNGDSGCSHACTRARNCTAKDRNDGKPLRSLNASPNNNNNNAYPSIFSQGELTRLANPIFSLIIVGISVLATGAW